MRIEGCDHAHLRTVAIVLVVVSSSLVTGMGSTSAPSRGGTTTKASVLDTTPSVDGKADADEATVQTGTNSTTDGDRRVIKHGTSRQRFRGTTDDIEIQHDPHSTLTDGGDERAEVLLLATRDSSGAFAFGGDLGRVLVIRDIETDRTIVLDPASPRINVSEVTFDIYEDEGDVQSDEPIRVELANGSHTDVDVDITGSTNLFRPDPSPFGKYRIELREGYQQGDSVGDTSLIDATGSRLIGIGYEGSMVQNNTTGTIQVSVPRHEDIDESWYIEYSVSNDTHRDLITKEVIDSADDENLTVEIDASKLENGSYSDSFTIRRSEKEIPLSSQVLSIFRVDDLTVGPRAVAVRDPLVAAFTVTPPRPSPNQTATFDASPSFGLNTTITEYEWAFGDGATATGERVSHSYTESGHYTVTLTVTGATGRTNTTSKTVTIRSEPQAPDVTGDGNPARDPDDDGAYEDVNGDGGATPGDATVLFDAVFEGNTAVTGNVSLFDFNSDGTVTSGDATALFDEVFSPRSAVSGGGSERTPLFVDIA